MFFSPEQWIVLTIVLLTVVALNLIVWLIVLHDQQKNRAHSAHLTEVVATKTPTHRILPPATRTALEKAAKKRLQESLDTTTAEFTADLGSARKKLQGDVTAASSSISQNLTAASEKMRQDLDVAATSLTQAISSTTEQMLQDETAVYRSLLTDARTQMMEKLESVHEAMEAQRQKAAQEVRDEIRAEKADLMKKFDTKLAEVLSAYLVESLGQNVDLGAQTKYIFSRLNENKTQLKEDILNDF